jgi:hypothetical protein
MSGVFGEADAQRRLRVPTKLTASTIAAAQMRFALIVPPYHAFCVMHTQRQPGPAQIKPAWARNAGAPPPCS